MTKTEKEIEDKYAEVFDFLTEQLYMSSKKLPESIRATYLNTTLDSIKFLVKARVLKLYDGDAK